MRRLTIAFAFVAATTLPAFAGDKSDPRCALYGEGFTYSESAGMCVKISGELRTDFKVGKKTKAFESQGEVTLDARKETEFGEMRIVVSPRISSGAQDLH